MSDIAQPLEEVYFKWLYNLVSDSEVLDDSGTNWNLIKTLHRIKFEYFYGRDDSRAYDGKALRVEFFREYASPVDWEWIEDIDCSMLELILGLSYRLEYQTDMTYDRWFWILLGNLGIDSLDDRARLSKVDKQVRLACHRVNARDYDSHGTGGLFPLRHSDRDVRNYDLWFQMSLYLQENIQF